MRSGQTILIIEEERILVDLLSHELVSYDIRVENAVTPQEAQSRLSEVRPDLVILDADIPNGMELVSDIRFADRPIAVIALTHSAEFSDRLAGSGIESFIDRSHGVRPLLAAIQTYLDLDVSSLPDQNIQVLVVDDEPDSLTFLTARLERWGYSVLTAKDGNDALQLIERTPSIALVLLDVLIRGRGGMEVLKEIRTVRPEVGIIITSPFADREIARQAIALGAFDYITKPFDLLSLESLLHACVSHTEYQSRSWWKRLIS